MKTPKRHYELTTMEHSANERVRDRTQEEVSAQRWKRKNRVKQLKRTIARLRRENFYMKIDLHIPVNISYDEYHSRRVDFTEKNPETYFDLV